VSGFGLTRLISYQIAPQLASGELKIVLAEYENKHMPIHVVHREGRHASVKVRAFIDLMAERLRANHSLS
jgi:DNA-binding transcriptional LysR family regulator